MARIAGVDLPNKATKIALTYIYGIGRFSAVEICEKTKIDPDANINTLSNEDLALLRHTIEEEYKVEGRLRTEVALNIKRLMDIGCYRGLVIVGSSRQGSADQDQCPHRKGRKKTVAGKKK